MANRKPSRLTERSHPRYRGSGAPMGSASRVASDDQASRRFAMVALGGLALAGVLLVGFMMTRRGGTDTAAAPTPTVASAAPTSVAVSTIPALTPAPSGVEGVRSTGAGLYTAPEDQAIDAAGKSYFVTWETPKGTIEAELWPEIAPITVNSFVFLARKGFYDGLTFHRVEPGFVVQGGDPDGNGTGGPGYEIRGEFNSDNPVPHSAGSLAMARSSDPDSAGSQFYFVLESGKAMHLDGQYAVFGQVTQGMDVVRQLAIGDVMTKVTVTEKDRAERITSPDDVRAGKLPEGVQ